MTGRVDFYFCPLLPALSLIRDGKLTALAVNSTHRSPDLPDVPTTTEAGFPNSEYNFWFGVFRACRATGRPSSSGSMTRSPKALHDPAVKAKLTRLTVQPMPTTPAQFNDYVAKELKQNAELAQEAGIKAQ